MGRLRARPHVRVSSAAATCSGLRGQLAGTVAIPPPILAARGAGPRDRALAALAELVAVALTMKEAVFCSIMMLELGFNAGFGTVPLYIYNTSALHGTGNRTYSPRADHITLGYFFVQELVEGNTTIHFLKKQD